MEAIQQAFRSIFATEILMLLAVVAFLAFTVLLVKNIGANCEEQNSSRRWWALAGIILLGLGLRVGWIAFTQPEPRSDFEVYWQYARNFYHGDFTYNVLIRHPGTIILQTFSFWLFGGPSYLAGWSMNLFLSAVIMLQVFALTRLLLGKRLPALIAAAMAALFPQLITYTALMSTEIPAVAFSFMVFWAVLHSLERKPDGKGKQSAWYWVGVGAMLYGTILIRSSNLLFLVLVPVLFLLTRRDHLKAWAVRYAVMALTTGLLLSSWVYHQYLVGGSPRLFWGDALWMVSAVNYKHQGGYTTANQMPEIWAKVEPAARLFKKTGNPRDEVRYYDVLGAEVMKIVKADPAKYILNGFPRLKRTLWTSQTGLRWSQKGSTALQKVPGKLVTRVATVSNVIWQVLLLLSPLGFINLRRKNALTSRETFLLTGLYLLAWLSFYFLLAEAYERYAVQIIPFVLMLSTSALTWLFATLKKLFTDNSPEGHVQQGPQAGISAV